MSIVGDFTDEEIESCVLDYLGTVCLPESTSNVHDIQPIMFRSAASDLHLQQVYVLLLALKFS